MKYRLKDKELQNKLDALSDVNRFSDRLEEECNDQYFDIYNYVKVSFGKIVDETRYSYKTFILKSDIVPCEEYNPKTWNKFPEVEPPEGVFMRVEMTEGGKACALFRHFSDGDLWCYPSGKSFPQAYSDSVIRFRPWLNDDEIEAERNAEYKKDMHPDAIAARRYMGEED